MQPDTFCKIVRQYNKTPLSDEVLQKLLELAADCRTVKNYVYQRYGGIKSLPKLYPGYTVQNEMTKSGLRAKLGLPSVYFYLAVFDALGDIKTQWAQVKRRVFENIRQHSGISPDEKHYLRFILKIDACFQAALLSQTPKLPLHLRRAYEQFEKQVPTEKLQSYLRRQVRKKLRPLHTDKADSFSLTEKAYRYADGGIYIASKEKRKRLFLPLTDKNQYSRQLRLRIDEETNGIELQIPVAARVRQSRGKKELGIALGMFVLLTTDEGKLYGKGFGAYQNALIEHIQRANARREKGAGRKKYKAKKKRLEAALHDYVNRELNRFFREERSAKLYLLQPFSARGGGTKSASVHLWQKGYIRKRLEQKCREQKVGVAYVAHGKDVGRKCSRCGGEGVRKGSEFSCPRCGLRLFEGENAARNVKKRGEESDLNPSEAAVNE